MKRTFLISLFTLTTIICTAAFKQDKIIITGEFKNGGNFDVYLDTTTGENSSSNAVMAKAINGKFTFEIDPVSVPTFAKIAFCGSNHSIILENNNISITYNRETGYEINGGFYNDLIFGWERSVEAKQICSQVFNLYKNGDKKPVSDNDSGDFASKLKSLNYKLDQLRKNYMNNLYSHKDPYIKLFAVIESNNRSDKEFEVLSGIKEELKDNADLQILFKAKAEVDKREDIKKRLVIGADFIDIDAQSLTGKKVNLAEIVKKNELTLFEFWASWCHPCRAEMKKLPAIYSIFKDKGFEIFSFSVDSDKDAWKRASNEMNNPWINTSSDKTGTDKIADSYAVESIPKNFLIDRSGKIVAVNIRADQLKPFLEEKLK